MIIYMYFFNLINGILSTLYGIHEHYCYSTCTVYSIHVHVFKTGCTVIVPAGARIIKKHLSLH